RTRRLFDVVTRGVCVTIGLFAALGIDELVTRLLLGGSVRTARTVDAAGEAGVGARVRIREAVHSTVQMGFSHRDVLLGCVFIAVLVYAAWAATHRRSAREVWAAFVLAVVI